MTDVTKAALTPARRRLVETMQEINYGRIERLEVRDWEPVFKAAAAGGAAARLWEGQQPERVPRQ